MSFTCRRCGGTAFDQIGVSTRQTVLGVKQHRNVDGTFCPVLSFDEPRPLRFPYFWYECSNCDETLKSEDGDYLTTEQVFEMLQADEEKPA